MNVHLSSWYDLTHISLLHPYNAIVYFLWSYHVFCRRCLSNFIHIISSHLCSTPVC